MLPLEIASYIYLAVAFLVAVTIFSDAPLSAWAGYPVAVAWPYFLALIVIARRLDRGARS